MRAEISAGRIIGVLIIIQMALGVMVNFVLEAPLFGQPGFLVNAAHYPHQLGVAVLLGLLTEALWVGIAVTAFPLFYRYSRTLTLWFTALAVVVLASAMVENAAVMSMVSLSEAYSKANPADRGQFEAIRGVVAAARNWPHFLARMLDGCTIFVFYAVLFRSALIPRVLAGLGMIAAVLQIAGVSMPLFGGDVIFPLLAPLGLIQLVVSVWLIVRGFRLSREAPSASRAD
jgi:Domain of unknown function (DUF4386)